MAHFQGLEVNLFGNLTRDPEITTTRNGNEMITFSVAVNHLEYNGESGNSETSVNFFNCRAFGVIGNQIYDKMRKGDFGWFSGSLKVRNYERRDGTPGYSLDVVIRDAHTNLSLVRRENSDSGQYRDDERSQGQGQDRDDDRNQGSDRDRDDDRNQGRGRDRDDDRGQGSDRDRDDDRSQGRGRERDDDRSQGRGRERDDDRNQGRGRERDDDRNQGRGRDRDDDRYGSWSQPSDTDDLPF